MIKQILLTICLGLSLTPTVSQGQSTSVDRNLPSPMVSYRDDNEEDKDEAPKVETIATYSLSGYVDVYYGMYTDSVGPGNFQKFPSISPRSNSPSLNTAMLTMQYNGKKMRSFTALHFGDFANSTWSNTYGPVMEAHMGVKVCDKLWVDAGLFRGHFGTEYLLPVENIASSLAVASYYEPYYESGLRLNYSPTSKFDINVYLLNGYGIYNDNNEKKSFGAALSYTFNEHWNIGYTNYIGDDSPPGDNTSHLRVAQNAFVNFQMKRLKVQVGGDYMMQGHSDLDDAGKTAGMFSALATIKYQLPKTFAICARGEMFNDGNGILTGVIKDRTGKMTGYALWGATLGAEYKPTPGSYVKLEGRMLQMDKDQFIFRYNGVGQNNRFEVMVHAGISFDIIRGAVTRPK